MTRLVRAVLGGCAAWLLAAAGPQSVTMSAEQQHTVGLATAQAVTRQITEPVRVPGTVAFAEGHVAELRPVASGRLVRLLATLGQTVAAGQPLAELDTPSLISAQEELATATGAMRSARAALAVARASAGRAEMLARDGSFSRAEAEQRRLVSEQADVSLQAATDRHATLQAEVVRLHPAGAPGIARIVSPIPGMVAAITANPGELVDAGARLVTVADLSTVLVAASIPEASAALVSVGDRAVVATSSGEVSLEGGIASLGAALDPASRSLPARIVLANAGQHLRAGMFVQVTITSRRGRSGTTVPSAAIQLVGTRHLAFVPAGGDRFEARELTVGVEGPDWTEVRSGLRAGEAVVTNGSFALKAALQQDLLGGAG